MRRSRLPGTPAERDMRRPVCSKGHSGSSILRVHGEWMCAECLQIQVKPRRVQLPRGVKDPDIRNIHDIFPNRAARRRARAHRSNA